MNSVAVAQGLLSLLCVIGLILLLGWLLRGRLRRCVPAAGIRSRSLRSWRSCARTHRRRPGGRALLGRRSGGLRTLLVLSRRCRSNRRHRTGGQLRAAGQMQCGGAETA
jgi:hypothetical protein